MNVRTDTVMELYVASGIAMSIYGTIFQAASFMFNRKVPLTVAVRTLLHPSQRRASDLK